MKFHDEIKTKLNFGSAWCILFCRRVIHVFKTMLPVACSFRFMCPPAQLYHQYFRLDTWNLNYRGTTRCLAVAHCHGECSL